MALAASLGENQTAPRVPCPGRCLASTFPHGMASDDDDDDEQEEQAVVLCLAPSAAELGLLCPPALLLVFVSVPFLLLFGAAEAEAFFLPCFLSSGKVQFKCRSNPVWFGLVWFSSVRFGSVCEATRRGAMLYFCVCM